MYLNKRRTIFLVLIAALVVIITAASLLLYGTSLFQSQPAKIDYQDLPAPILIGDIVVFQSQLAKIDYQDLPAPILIGDIDDPDIYDICLIASWTGKSLASYHRLLLFTANKSITGNSKLYLIHEGINDNQTFSKYPNVNFLNLHSIPQFVGRRMCEYYNVQNDYQKCNATIDALVHSDDFVPGSAVAQYRVMFGYALSGWIGPQRCKSWAFVDNDMILGNVTLFINENGYFWDSDVVSFSPGHREGLFTNGQFTAHIQTRRPEFVNSLFKGCKLLSDHDSFINTFTGNSVANSLGFFAMDEGCYSKGIISNPDSVLTFMTYQKDPWSCPEFVVWIKGSLFCFERQDILEHMNESSLNSTRFPNTGYKDLYEQIPNFENEILFFEIDNDDCTTWIPSEHRSCVNYSNLISKYENLGIHESDSWKYIQRKILRVSKTSMNGKLAKFISKLPDNYTQKEFAFFHMHYWKDLYNLDNFNETFDYFVADLKSGYVNSSKSWEEIVDKIIVL